MPKATRTTKPRNSGGVGKNGEAHIQAAIVHWFRLVAPNCLIFAVPNGGYRTKPEASRLKWTGTLAGVSDLVIVDEHGLVYFLEIKQAGEQLSDSQKDFKALCRKNRWPFDVATSVTEASKIVAGWGIKTREAKAYAAT